MMKKLKYLCLGLALLPALTMSAEECSINLMVIPSEQGEQVPEDAQGLLLSRLENAVTANGISGDANYGQFFITGKFNHIYKDVVPGPPMKHTITSELTIYVGDVISKSIYSSVSIPLKGVGTTEQRAIIGALQVVNGKNPELQKLITKGKDKIIDYFNKHYIQLLNEAQRAAVEKKYDKALYYTTQIPACCDGYEKSLEATKKYYQSYIDDYGQKMLAAAKGEWAKSHDASSAEAAWEYLNQIDPSSSVYPQAEALMEKIIETTKMDKEFETRTKYRDSVETERAGIEAARAIGVAWGNGQQPTTTNITWLH